MLDDESIREMIEELSDLDPADTERHAVRSSATAEDLPIAAFAGQRVRVDGTNGTVEILE